MGWSAGRAGPGGGDGALGLRATRDSAVMPRSGRPRRDFACDFSPRSPNTGLLADRSREEAKKARDLSETNQEIGSSEGSRWLIHNRRTKFVETE
jgi:hypothetical protein